MALVTGEKSLIVVRVLLGIAEAGFFPGVVVYLSQWFPREYRARIVGMFMVAIPLSSVLGAPVSSVILATRLAALGGPVRAQLCRALARRPYSTAELARDLGMAPEQASRHLRRLREAGLARTRRQGKPVFYELDVAAVGRLGQDLLATLRR